MELGIEANRQALILPETPPDRYSPEAKLVLESLRLRPKNRRTPTPPKPRIPDTNKNGLVIPPAPASYNPKKLTEWQRTHGTYNSKHHLHWPKAAFEEAGPLAREFRENKYNIRELPNFQHRKMHRRHDPFILRYPTYLIPDDEVMVTFLDEASNLEMLGIEVRRLDRMLDGLDEFNSEQEEKIEHSLEQASIFCTKVVQSEIIFPTFVQQAITKAQRYVPVEFSGRIAS